MKLSLSPIKVVILVVLMYLLVIGLANIMVNSNKDVLLEQLEIFDIHAKIKRVVITPDLLVRLEGVEISNSDFTATLKDIELMIDARKLILRRIPISYLYTSNVVIQLLSIDSSAIGTNQFERKYIHDILSLLQGSRFRFNDITIITEGIRVRINNASINVIDGNVVFDVLTQIKLELNEATPILQSTLESSGIITMDNQGNISNLNGFLVFTSNYLFNTGIVDVKVHLSKQDNGIVGIFLDPDYYAYMELSSESIKLEIQVYDLLDRLYPASSYLAALIPPEFVPDVEDMFKSILRNSIITFKLSRNETFLNVISTNFYVYYERLGEDTTLKVRYRNANSKRLSIDLENGVLSFSIKNFYLGKLKLDGYFLSEVKDNIKINSSYIGIGPVKGSLLNGMIINSNRIVVVNSYLDGSIRLDKLDGRIEIKDKLLSQILENVPFLNSSNIVVVVSFSNTNFLLHINGENDQVIADVRINNNFINIKRLNIKNLELSLEGEILYNSDYATGIVKLKRQNIEDYFRVTGNSSKISLVSRKYGSIDLDVKALLVKLSLKDIPLGDLTLTKLQGIVGDNINVEIGLKFGTFHLKSDLIGSFESIVITNGFIYTETRAVEFSGDLKISDVVISRLKIGDSRILVILGLPERLDIIADFKKLPLAFGVVSWIDGSLRTRLNMTKKHLYEMIEEIIADIYLKTEGIFNRVRLNAYKDESIKINATIVNYYNIFYLYTVFNKYSLSSRLYFKERVGNARTSRDAVQIIGRFLEDKFEGWVNVDTQGFSGLNEKWQRKLVVGGNIIKLEGTGDGLNIYKDSGTLTVSYTRNNEKLYEYKAEIQEGVVDGYLNGKVPVEFLIVPGFVDNIEGILEFGKTRVVIKPDGLDMHGYAILSLKSIRINFINSVFSVQRANVELRDSKIIAKNIPLSSGNITVNVSSVIDLKNIGDPSLDISIVNLRGNLSLNLDLGGGLIIQGPSVANLNIRGRANAPQISGNIRLLDNSKVYYFIVQVGQIDEFFGYNFSQLADWNLSISITNSHFESEVINGRVDYGNIVVKGSFAKNTLLLTGSANISSGDLIYLGRNFNIDNLKIVFSGEEMDFVPFVSGTLYTYAFDNRTEENVRVILDVSGKATSIRSSFRSQPERSQSEIASLLGLPTELRGTLKQGISLIEKVGLYEALSYNVRRYTGLDVFTFRSPFVSTYFLSLVEGNPFFTFRDIIKGTELRIGKNIIPNVLLEYRLLLDTVGSEREFTNVVLHNFIVSWSIYNFLLEFQYSSSLVENKPVFEPRLNVRYNRRF